MKKKTYLGPNDMIGGVVVAVLCHRPATSPGGGGGASDGGWW